VRTRVCRSDYDRGGNRDLPPPLFSPNTFKGEATALGGQWAAGADPAASKKTAAGTLSRRLQNAAKNWVDFRGLLRTPVESTSSGKHRRVNALASEVARHQQVTKTADFSFNSRRLH